MLGTEHLKCYEQIKIKEETRDDFLQHAESAKQKNIPIWWLFQSLKCEDNEMECRGEKRVAGVRTRGW